MVYSGEATTIRPSLLASSTVYTPAFSTMISPAKVPSSRGVSSITSESSTRILPAGSRDGGPDGHLHPGAGQGSDVSTALHLPGAQARVGREIVSVIHLLHVGQVGHLDGVPGGPDAIGLNEVLGVLHQIQKEKVEPGAVGGEHGDALVRILLGSSGE